MNFVGKRRWVFLLSLAVILPGVVFLIVAPGLKPGIDFTGGSAISLKFADDVTLENLRTELAGLDHPDAVVQRLGDDTYFIRTKELNPGTEGRPCRTCGVCPVSQRGRCPLF